MSSVDDVVQDVFIVVHRKLADFPVGGSLRGWLFGIAKRVSRDFRRAKSRRGISLELEPQHAVDDSGGPERDAGTRQALLLVEGFADTLSDEHRELFFLTLVDGLQTFEAAEILGMNPNTAYSRVKVLRQGLAAHLEQMNRTRGAANG